MNAKGGIRLLVIIRPVLIILIILAIFFSYNLFLVDRSLEMLKFSLSTVASAETVGSVSYVAPLMQVQFIDELLSAKLETEDLMRLQYGADVIGTSDAERKVADVTSVMQEIINKKEQERHILLRFFDKANSYLKRLFKKVPAWRIKEVTHQNMDPTILKEITGYENIGEFDKAIRLYRDTIVQFPDYAQTPAIMLRLGYLLHKLGRFEEAKLVYEQVIDSFSTMAESKVAKVLIAKIEEREGLAEKAEEMISEITLTADKERKQKLYYELGLMELSVLNLQKAKESFRRAIFILPDTNLTAQSYLRLGICERLLGDLDASVEAFKKASDITKSAEVKTQSKYQLAQSYRQKGEYKEATSTLDDIAEEEENLDIKSLLLFQKGSTLLYDERDISKAKQVFDQLMRRYSAHAMVSPGSSATFVDFVKKHVDLNILARKPEELERLLEKAWVEALLPEKVLGIIESNSTKVMNSLNKAVGGIAKLKEQALKEGVYVRVEFSERELNDFIESSLLKAGRTAISDISVEFEGDQKLAITVTLRQKQKPIKVFVAGDFKMVSIASVPYWVSTTKRRNLLIFSVEKCRIGKIPVPPGIVNPLFRPAFENFNESFPLDLEEFRIDRSTMSFAGLMRPDYVKDLKASTVTTEQMPSEKVLKSLLKGVAVKKLRR